MSASILVADDERGIVEMLTWELSGLGHDVTPATNGVEAIEKILTTEFDVIITDIRMPGANGIDVLRKAKEVAPDTEVIVATGYAEMDAAIECLRHGAFDFVQKPFDMHDLLATVDRAIERRHLRAATALYQASQVILSSSEPQRLPELIAEVALKAMAADDVALLLPGAGQRLYVAHHHGLAPELMSDACAFAERVARLVETSRQPTLFAHGLAKDDRFSDIALCSRMRSSIVHPLFAGDHLVAVLNLNRVEESRPFRKDDLDRSTVLASQVLLALENRRLLQQVATSERLAAVGQLATGVAHEIGNPLAAVIAAQDLLRIRMEPLLALDALLAKGATAEALQAWQAQHGGTLHATLSDVLRDASESAFHIADIVNDIRSLAKNEAETPALIDLNEAVRSALRITGFELRYKTRVKVELGSDTAVVANQGRLSQVFINLLVNASQSMDKKQAARNMIAITTRRDGDRIVAEVADNGPGILPEHLPRLFETFFTTKGSGGTGLGLSISRDILRRYGGDLRIQSTYGSGATFAVELPAVRRTQH